MTLCVGCSQDVNSSQGQIRRTDALAKILPLEFASSALSVCRALGVLLVLLVTTLPSLGQYTANVTIPTNAATSAGVYTTNGTLIRTLWNNVRREAGTVKVTWDGKDDSGFFAVAGSYVTKLIYHNVSAVWEGIIGNTSQSLVGPTAHRTTPMVSLTFDATNGYFCTGYAEAQDAVARFAVTNPQARFDLPHSDFKRSFTHVTTDGNLVYYANTGNGWDAQNFVIAINTTNFTEYAFSAGTPQSDPAPDHTWVSTIARDTTGNLADTTTIYGLAVQKTGNRLFIAKRRTNAVHIYNKSTGQYLSSLAITAPNGLAVNKDDDLWVISGTSVLRYTNLSGTPTVAATISGLVNPLAIAVSPLDNTLVIADGGTNQQLKAYDKYGAPLWTYGRAGGYQSNGPDVTTDKFAFAAPCFMAFQTDGTFWVNDTGNGRVLHFTAGRDYLGQIAVCGSFYTSAIDLNNPTRAFSGWLEFSVDYSKPIQQSWTLVKNWQGSAPTNLTSESGFKSVVTLTNQRTYGLIFHGDQYHIGGGYWVVELPLVGPLRSTGQVLWDARSASGYGPVGAIHSDGSWYYPVDLTNRQAIAFRPVVSFDANNNPQWGNAITNASAPITGVKDPYYRSGFNGALGAQCPVTDSGVVIYFNPNKDNGWHLGGVRTNTTNWLWKSSPSGFWLTDTNGMITNKTGIFDISTNVPYAGNTVMARGKAIIYGYHGEFWGGGQANQWLHFHENGLFVNQFGTPNTGPSAGLTFPPGAAGNTFSPTLVVYSNQLYLYHNDENAHAGIHRWRIEGWDQVQELTAPLVAGAGNLPPTVTLTSPTNLAAFAPAANVTLTATATDADGVITKVEFLQNGSVIGTSTTAPYSFIWTNVPAGLYSLTARATDNVGAVTMSSSSNISVGTSFGLRGEYFNGSNFNTSVFTRADRAINFNWGNGSPGAGVAADNFSVRWTGKLIPHYSDNYVFYAAGDDSVRIWVDGKLLVYQRWAVTSGDGDQGSIYLNAGQKYDIKIELVESVGNASIGVIWSCGRFTKQPLPATWMIATNLPAANLPPTVSIAYPANNTVVSSPANITINAVANDPDGAVHHVDFLQNGTFVGSVSAPPYFITLPGVNAGVYSYTARAFDNSNTWVTSAPITVTVDGANPPPAVTITSPTNGTVVANGPVNLTLTTTVSDINGTVAKVEFFRDGVKIGEDLSSPFIFVVTNLAAGVHSFSARATDNLGATTDSSVINVTVNSPVAPAGNAMVDFNNVRQSIDGFGAAFPGASSWIFLTDGPNHSGRCTKEILDTLFSTNLGIGLSITRSEVMADNHDSIYSSVWWINSIEPSEGNWVWDGDRHQVWLMQQAASYGVTNFLSTVWSPPPWMKYNNDYTGFANTNGEARLRFEKYQAYADYLSRYVREYRLRHGVNISALSIANEPDFAAWYQACVWSPTEMATFLRDYLLGTFKKGSGSVQASQSGQIVTLTSGAESQPLRFASTDDEKGKIIRWAGGQTASIVRILAPDVAIVAESQTIAPATFILEVPVSIVAPENSGWAPPERENAILSDPGAAAAVQIIAEHGYGGGISPKPQVKTAGKRLWMTEVTGQDLSRDNSGSIADALRWAKHIHNLMTTAEINAYIWWWAAHQGNGTETDSEQGLLHVDLNDPNANTWRQTKRLWSIGNFSRFVRPGFVHVSSAPMADTNLYVSGFKDPTNNQFVIVAINDSAANKTITFNTTGATGLSSVTPYITSLTQNLEPQPAIPVNSERFTFALPSNSVVTFVKTPTLLPAPPTRDTLLTSIDWVNASTASINRILRDGSSPGSWGTVQNPLHWQNNPSAYTNGIGFDSPASVMYNVAGRCSTFTTDIFVSDGYSTNDAIRFQLWADGALVQDFGLARVADLPRQVTANISGKQIIKLVGLPAGTNANIPGVWGTPRVTYSLGPSALITSPVNGAAFSFGSSVPVAVSASTATGSVSKVELFQGANLIGTATSSPYGFVWPNPSAGNYSLIAKVTDTMGNSATSSPVTISITPNQPPSVTLLTPSNNAVFSALSSVLLTADALDGDGTITRVDFYQDSTLIGTVTNAPYALVWNNVPAGTYLVSATATDNHGGTAGSSQNYISVGATTFRDPENPTGVTYGIDYNYYQGTWSAIPTLTGLTPRQSGATANFDIVSTRLTNNSFAHLFTGYVSVPADGTYTFYTASSDGSRLYIGKTLVVNNDGTHSLVEQSGQIALKAGLHAITLEFFAASGTPQLTVSYSGPGLPKQTIPNSALYHVGANNLAPAINITSPADGSIFTAPTSITLSANASDLDSGITKVEFFQGSVKIGESAVPPYATTWSATNLGTFSLQAIATDVGGAISASTAINVTLIAPAITSAQLQGDGGYQLTLNGSIGRLNTLEASTNLVDWIAITNGVNNSGSVTLRDAQASQFPQRFYRVWIESVYSSNVMGFARITIPPGFSMIANQFYTSNSTVAGLFPNVPNGTAISLFRNATGDFSIDSFDADFQQWDDPGLQINTGSAAFILNPTSTNLSVTMQGEVPQGQLNIFLAPGYSMISSPTPRAGRLQTDLGYVPTGGESVYQFRRGGYIISQFDPDFVEWDAEPRLNVGEGFFIYRATNGVWSRTFNLTR